MNNLTFESAESEDLFFKKAKDDLVFVIKETLKDYEQCRIGLAGGTTPQKLYELLAKEPLDWDKIILVQLDERYVPSDDPESNLKMIRRALVSKIPLPPENLVAFDTSLPIESAAKDMSRKMIALSHKRFPIFDLLVLGAGADGHIASLFEGNEALECTYYSCSVNAEHQKTKLRLTLSLITLKNSSRTLLLLKGPQKAPVLKALKGESAEPKCSAIKELIPKMPVKVLSYLE